MQEKIIEHYQCKKCGHDQCTKIPVKSIGKTFIRCSRCRYEEAIEYVRKNH